MLLSTRQCSAPCGEGVQFRQVSCVGGLACREKDEPKIVQDCVGDCLDEGTFLEIDDAFLDESQSTTTTEPQSTTTTEPQFTTTTGSQSTTTTGSQSTTTTGSQSTTTTESQSTTTTEPQSTTTTGLQSTTTTESQSTTTTESQSTTTIEPQSTTTTEPLWTTITEPQSTTTTELQSTTVAQPTLNTTGPEHPTTPTSIPATTSGAPHGTIPATVTSYGRTTTDPSVSGPPLSHSTTTVSSISGETTQVPVTEVITTVRTTLSSTVSQSLDETTVESTVMTTVPSSTTTTEKRVLPNTTIVLSSTPESDPTSLPDADSQTPEITTETEVDVLLSSPATTSQLSTISPVDSGSQENESVQEDTVEETHMDVEEVERIEGQNKLGNVSDTDTSVDIVNASSTERVITDKHKENDTVIEESLPEDVKVQDTTSTEDILESSPEVDHDNIDVMETLNEVDVDSKPVAPEDRAFFDDDFLDKKRSKPESKLDPQVTSDQADVSPTTQPTPDEEDLLESDEPTYMEDPSEMDIYTEVEEPFEVEEYLNEEQPEEKRPNETIVDKIDVDDFEVIEIVELPAKGKRKKKRKKVLLHTGAEAVDVLNELAEEQDAKKTTTPLPDTIVEDEPEYEWNVGHWSEVRISKVPVAFMIFYPLLRNVRRFMRHICCAVILLFLGTLPLSCDIFT